MIIYWKNHVNAYSGAHYYLSDAFRPVVQQIGNPPAAVFIYPTGVSAGVTVDDVNINLGLILQGIEISTTVEPVWTNIHLNADAWTEVEDRDTDEAWTEVEDRTTDEDWTEVTH